MNAPLVHPVAAWFPLLDGEDLELLARDIAANGLLDPIVTWKGQILDGRNRLAACELAGVEPEFREWEGDESELVAWILSKNLHRRHLTTSQRALIAARFAARPADGSGHDPGKFAGVPTQAEAAERLHVSERSVRDARAVLEHGSHELVAKVEAGTVTVSTAAREVRPAWFPPPADPPLDLDDPAVQGHLAALDEEDDDSEELIVVEPSREERIESARRELRELEPTPEELRQVLADRPASDVRAAVRTPRRVNDAYYTPDRVAEVCVDHLRVQYGTRALEPSVGGGAWARALAGGRTTLTVLDIDPNAVGLAFGDEQIVGDFLTHDFGDERFDLIIGNPPYDAAEVHVRKALELLAPRGRLAFLLRRNWASSARFPLFLDEDRAPAEEHVLGPRVSFTGEGTDSQEYSLFVWHAGDERVSWQTHPLRWRA